MAAIISRKQSLINATNFIDTYSGNDTTLYLGIAKTDPWNSVLTSTVDGDAPIPVDGPSDYANFRNNLIAMKRILPTYFSKAAIRHDWQSGSAYVAWDDADADIDSKEYYVIATGYKIYKCLKSTGGSSTVEPTHTSTEPQRYADGYVWHYMYTIPTADVVDFLNTDYMPVKNSSSAEHIAHEAACETALDGSIFNIVVTEGGTGYTTPTVTIVGKDNTVDATATATVVGGTITEINITVTGSTPDHGKGYKSAEVVISAPSSGTQAVARAVLAPDNGHGTNAEHELSAYFVEIKNNFIENDTIEANDFRQLALIKDPVDYVGGSPNADPSTTDVLNALYSMTLTGVTGAFSSDDVIRQTTMTNTTATAYVDDVSEDGLTLYYHQNNKTQWVDFEVGATIKDTNGTGSNVGTIASIVPPEVVAYSGDILFLENRSPIPRSSTTKEEIRIVIQF